MSKRPGSVMTAHGVLCPTLRSVPPYLRQRGDADTVGKTCFLRNRPKLLTALLTLKLAVDKR